MGSSVSSLKASSRSLFGVALLDIVNSGKFEDGWKFENSSSVYVGEFKICHSGLHNYVIFTGFNVGKFYLDRYLFAQKMMYDVAEGANVANVIDTRETIPMSFAFDLVVDQLLEVTLLRFMAPRIFSYQEIDSMGPVDEMQLYVYTMTDLKQVIQNVYQNFGNYNLVKSDCRVFASRVLDALHQQQPTSFSRLDLVLATKSLLESNRSDVALEKFTTKEKLLTAKTFEAVGYLWGEVTRKLTEYCVFECLQGKVDYQNFVEVFLGRLAKNTPEDTMLFLRMNSGWFQMKSVMKASPAWNVSSTLPHVPIKYITSRVSPGQQTEVDLAFKSEQDRLILEGI